VYSTSCAANARTPAAAKKSATHAVSKNILPFILPIRNHLLNKQKPPLAPQWSLFS
jgi:hypothetical protein